MEEPILVEADDGLVYKLLRAEGSVERKLVAMTPRFDEFLALIKPGLHATQVRPGCAIWVEGDTSGLDETLRSLGFEHSPNRDQYYLRVMPTY